MATIMMNQVQGSAAGELALLQTFMDRHRKVVVLTGAGCSTSSGIPAYRDASGTWQRSTPIQHNEFIGQRAARQRYWARSLVGWRHVLAARPNAIHDTLAEWERTGRIELLITQNVDGLHRRAGSENLVELHGALERVFCLQCQQADTRAAVQIQLAKHNPDLVKYVASAGPDGDADVDGLDLSSVVTPLCEHCGGDLMPDVVFFGGTVPKTRVQRCREAIQQADALLVLGSSLMVYSGFRFCRDAAALGKPIAVVNQGVTRADDLLQLKVSADVAEALAAIT